MTLQYRPGIWQEFPCASHDRVVIFTRWTLVGHFGVEGSGHSRNVWASGLATVAMTW